MLFSLEVYQKDGEKYARLSQQCAYSPGVEYSCSSPKELGEAVAEYLENYYPDFFEESGKEGDIS